MIWTIHSDGYWYAYGKTGQRYEVGEMGSGWMLLNICGVRMLSGDTAGICKQWAEEHNNEQA